jgi:hypothetical protein
MSELAVALHLGYIELWEDANKYLKRITVPFDLYITYRSELPDNKEEVLKEYPNAVILHNENKGSDIGPFFMTMDYMRKNNIVHKWIIKLHTKSDPKWRKQMFEALIPDNFANFYEKLNNSNNKIYGAYIFQYDYFNIYWDIKNIKLLNLNATFNWEKYETQFPNVKNLKPIEKVKHYLKFNRNNKHLRPVIDQELYEDLFGEMKIDQELLTGQEKFKLITQIYENDNVLYYYPGTCFTINHNIWNEIYKDVDYVEIFKSLEYNKPNDNIVQSNTHSWERIMCMAFQLYKQ